MMIIGLFICLPDTSTLRVSVGRILSLTCEISSVMFNTGNKFQNGHSDKTFTIVHQFLNSSNPLCQDQTSIVNPCDLKPKMIYSEILLSFSFGKQRNEFERFWLLKLACYNLAPTRCRILPNREMHSLPENLKKYTYREWHY